MRQKSMAKTLLFALLKVVVFVLVIVALVSVGKKAYSFGYKVFAEEAVSKPPGKDVAVTIEDDTSSGELGELLEDKGLIRDAKVFQVQYLLSGYKGKLKKGSYILNTSQTAEEMLAVLSGEQETESETSE